MHQTKIIKPQSQFHQTNADKTLKIGFIDNIQKRSKIFIYPYIAKKNYARLQ